MRECYRVSCWSNDLNCHIYEGVITDGWDNAAKAAVKSLQEGRHLKNLIVDEISLVDGI